MKRKSTMILIAALVLAITLPAFAFAAGYGNTSDRTFGRGNTASQAAAVQQGAQLMLQDCDLAEDCDCEAQGTGLGADGEALHQFARFTDDEHLYLNAQDGSQAFGRMGRSASQTVGSGNSPWMD